MTQSACNANDPVENETRIVDEVTIAVFLQVDGTPEITDQKALLAEVQCAFGNGDHVTHVWRKSPCANLGSGSFGR